MHRPLLIIFFFMLVCTHSFAVLGGVDNPVALQVKALAERGESVEALILLDDTAELQAESISLLNRIRGGRESKEEYNLRMQHRKDRLKTLKAQVKSELVDTDMEILRDYAVLPVMHVRVDSAQALNRLIRHSKVRSIDENLSIQPVLAQSLPLIGQPTAWNNGSGYGGAGTTIAVLDSRC